MDFRRSRCCDWQMRVGAMHERLRALACDYECLRAFTSVYEEILSVAAAADCLRSRRHGHFAVMRRAGTRWRWNGKLDSGASSDEI